MTTTRSRGFKRESTVVKGMLTPDDSFAFVGDSQRNSLYDAEDTPVAANHGLPRNMRHSTDLRSVSVSVQRHTDPSPASTGVEDALPRSEADAHAGLSVLGRDVNRLVTLIDKLRRIGLKSIDGALPELVLVGDQSAGKSSLMGAIAEINLPKNASMCTRCPYNIKTSPATHWECTVSLQEDHVYESAGRKGQPPKWSLREGMVTRLFKKIDKKAELENVLTWAQIALLNPSTEFEVFVPGSAQHATRNHANQPEFEVEYSPNVVAVEIRGPGLPALSFFDLPGLILDAGTPELQFLVKVFDELTVKYIKHESAIIICTRTMSSDAALSKTNRLIRQNKAEHKCVGVLTMPDRLQGTAKSHTDFDGIFRGTLHKLHRGHYVTKQPGPDSQLNKLAPNYHALARAEEERFFDESAHWGPGGEWAEFRDRCGTGVIAQYLSKEFARQILASLPDLSAKIADQMREADAELARLPETPNNRVQGIVREHLQSFRDGVKKSLGDTESFQNKWQRLCEQFILAIELMRPGLICNHPDDSFREVITIDDSESEVVFTPRGSLRRQREETYSGNRDPKRPRLNDTPIPFNPHTPHRIKAEDGVAVMSPTVRNLNEDKIGPFRQRYLESGTGAMTLQGIRNRVNQTRKVGVPGSVNDIVKEEVVLQAIWFWKQPLDTFLRETFQSLRQTIIEVLDDILQNHKHTELYKQSLQFIDEFLSTHEDAQGAIVNNLLDVEKASLFTVNSGAFKRHEAEAYELLKATRRSSRVNSYTDAHFKSKAHGDPERDKKEREAFKKAVKDEQLGPDHADTELRIAAYIRGYYTTARLRFTDSVCASIHSHFLLPVRDQILKLLETKFDLNQGNAEEKCQVLLEGSAEIAQRRTHWRNRKAQLTEFAKTLDELTNDTFADAPNPRGSEHEDASSVSTTHEYEARPVVGSRR